MYLSNLSYYAPDKIQVRHKNKHNKQISKIR